MELTPLRIFWSTLAIGLGLALIWVNEAEAVSPSVVEMAAHGVPAAPGIRPRSAVVTCSPPNAFNPDAGVGQVVVGTGPVAGNYTAFNIENESATAAYFCWRRTGANTGGVTKANYTTACRKRCNGCAGGISYAGEITNAGLDLFCIAGVSTDAGITVAVEVAQ